MTDKPKGIAAIARLTPASNPFYKNNVLIEALPPYDMMSERRLKEILCSRNPMPPEPEEMTLEEKISFLSTIFSNVFVCLPDHLRLFRAIDSLLRLGYLRRKKIDFGKIFPAKSSQSQEQQEQEEPAGYEYVPFDENDDKYGLIGNGTSSHRAVATTTPAMCVIGWSGLGKTCSCEHILSFFPQIIEHPQTPINEHFYQVVWLKVVCPPKLSAIELCANILQALDDAAHTHYRNQITHGLSLTHVKNVTVRTLKKYCVGLLVIDEIQNFISQAHQESFFNFIVELSNTLQTSLLFVGTPKIESFLNRDFRILRRFGSMGYFKWSRLYVPAPAAKKKDALANKNEVSGFDVFCNSLSLYNLADQEKELSPMVRQVLYDKSQGVIDVLVQLYTLSQIECLHYRCPFNADAIVTVFEKHFSKLNSIMSALKDGKLEKLERYPDLALSKEDMANLVTDICLDENVEPDEEEPDPKLTIEQQVDLEYSAAAVKLARAFTDHLRMSTYELTEEELDDLHELFIKKLIDDPDYTLADAMDDVENKIEQRDQKEKPGDKPS